MFLFTAEIGVRRVGREEKRNRGNGLGINDNLYARELANWKAPMILLDNIINAIVT
jgi:hypothetical protein